MKIILVVLLLLVLVGSVIVYYLERVENMEENVEGKVYQGPVPEGYDLDHFRKTGETKLLVNENG